MPYTFIPQGPEAQKVFINYKQSAWWSAKFLPLFKSILSPPAEGRKGLNPPPVDEDSSIRPLRNLFNIVIIGFWICYKFYLYTTRADVPQQWHAARFQHIRISYRGLQLYRVYNVVSFYKWLSTGSYTETILKSNSGLFPSSVVQFSSLHRPVYLPLHQQEGTVLRQVQPRRRQTEPFCCGHVG